MNLIFRLFCIYSVTAINYSRHMSYLSTPCYKVSTCSDQQEMEAQIVAAFDDVKQNIERQRSKMKSAGVLSEN